MQHDLHRAPSYGARSTPSAVTRVARSTKSLSRSYDIRDYHGAITTTTLLLHSRSSKFQHRAVHTFSYDSSSDCRGGSSQNGTQTLWQHQITPKVPTWHTRGKVCLAVSMILGALPRISRLKMIPGQSCLSFLRRTPPTAPMRCSVVGFFRPGCPCPISKI